MTSADPQMASPEELAQRCKAGCRVSFEALVGSFEKRIFNFVSQYVRNSHDAEDLTQETFLKVYHNIHRYDPNNSFAAWIYIIAKRTALNHLRAVRHTEELAADYPDDSAAPSAVLESRDGRESLWAKARKLKPAQYEALWLRYGEGFSVAESARIMGRTQIYVKVLLHRGRLNLAKMLDREKIGF